MSDVIDAEEKVRAKLKEWLWPKRDTCNPNCYPWRQNIATTVIILLIVVPSMAFLDRGGAEPHIHGFVTSDKLASLNEKVDYLTQDRMEQRLQDKFWMSCDVSGDTRRRLLGEIASLQDKYQTMFGRRFWMGPCK